jgi:hypothetical protein
MGIDVLDKHRKYHESYTPNDIFWGLGVEHEVYLETSQKKQIYIEELKLKMKRERYSVDYLKVYKPGFYAAAIDILIDKVNTGDVHPLYIPILANSHSLMKCDKNGEHATLYTNKNPPQKNPKFTQPLFEELCELSPALKDMYEKEYLFDGDTVEFTTLKFRNAAVTDVVSELESQEKRFVGELNAAVARIEGDAPIKKYAPFKIAPANYPFASYLTNIGNNAMFNNGTFHINITLPTKLDENRRIADWGRFVTRHRRLARIIQWFEPLIIGLYCSRDPFSTCSPPHMKASAASQRLAVSRYIGIGTYDTDTMRRGKILTVPRKELWSCTCACDNWYDTYGKGSAYMQLDEIGMDINFNKHYNHGLELRFLDSMSYDKLREVLDAICLIANYSESLGDDIQIDDPRKSPIWHDIVCGIMERGASYSFSTGQLKELGRILGIGCGDIQFPSNRNIEMSYLSLLNEYNKLYGKSGPMSAAISGLPLRRTSTAPALIVPAPTAPAPAPASKIGCTIFLNFIRRKKHRHA